jgi:hypothetical protein
MTITNLIERRVDAQVERLFRENPPRYDKICTNPVTGSQYVGGIDPIDREKRIARQPLLARERFALNSPADAQPLPVSYDEREKLKGGQGLLPYLVALYARSLESRQYDCEEHPRFEEYAAGVLWEAARPDSKIGCLPNYPDHQLAALKKRFPPRMLAAMEPGFYWEPPPVHAQGTASRPRSARRG